MDVSAATQNILQHHLTAFSENNIDELIKDYTEESCVCTPDGQLKGLTPIRSFYVEAFKLFPTINTKLEVKQLIINTNKAYIVWNSDSSVATVPLGTDSFEIENGKIIWQSLAAHILLK